MIAINMIKRIYLEDHNQVLESIRDSFEIVDNWMEAEAVVVWQDIRGELVQIVANANLVGIPTVVMQHGLRASREYSSDFGKMLLAKKIMVWGPKDKERVMSGGVEAERVEVTGTSIFESLKEPETHEGKNVLFVPLHWDKEIIENFEVARKLASIKGINIRTKLIEGQEESQYQNVIRSNRDQTGHLETIGKILKTTDLVVSLSESTLEFMAYYLEIPVITVNNWKPKYFLDTYIEKIDKYFSGANIEANLDNLETKIFEVLNNKQIKAKERQRALYEEAGVGYGKTSARERMIEVIRKLG